MSGQRTNLNEVINVQTRTQRTRLHKELYPDARSEEPTTVFMHAAYWNPSHSPESGIKIFFNYKKCIDNISNQYLIARNLVLRAFKIQMYSAERLQSKAYGTLKPDLQCLYVNIIIWPAIYLNANIGQSIVTKQIYRTSDLKIQPRSCLRIFNKVEHSYTKIWDE